MKNTIFMLILVLALSIFTVGCQPFNRTENQSGEGGGLTADKNDNLNDENANPENNTNIPENESSNPESNGETNKNDNLPPENGDNSGDVNPPEGDGNDNIPPEDSEDNSTDGEGGENPPKDTEDEEGGITPPEGGEGGNVIPENPEGGENGENPPEQEPTAQLPEIGTAVGFRFKDVTLEKMDGGTINTADLRGKIVIVNIWADWCPPCKAELPDFNRIATEYKDKVVIIAADSDSGQGTAKSYVDNNFPETDIVFAYDTHYSDAYRAAGGNGYVPYTAIMDENGVIVYSDSGMLTYEWLVNMIEGLLK